MKQLFTFLFISLCIPLVNAQTCSDLFFSEYVEGWSNNKALEIYNPTPNTIDLAAYSISRYSNGGTSPSTTQLSGTISPYSTFVIGLDKRDPNGEGYEAPMWDGYYTYTDSVNGQEVTTYDASSDLQGKVDLFANPIYYFGTDADSSAMYPTSMYFNGNDAITLEVLGGGILDIFGKVGTDPGAAWGDSDGNYWTKDHTLIRKADVLMGVMANPLSFDPTLQWDSLPANTFDNLGTHVCNCGSSNILENTHTFSIYPNPTSNSYVKISNDLAIESITLFNNLGQTVFQKNINGVENIELLLPNTKGLYFIAIEDIRGTHTQSIVLR